MANTVSRTISDDTLSCAIQIESAGKPLAKASTSSALGLGQFLNATWLETVRRHRPDWCVGRSDAQVLALRKDPKCSIEMLARHWEDNGKAMGSYESGDLYLAHFAGVGTARKLVRASASADCATVFDQRAINANRSILAGKTCGQVRAWATSKMAKAGGRNWVAVFMAGAKPSAPPAIKNATKAVVVAAPSVAAGGVQQGWSTGHVLIAVGITIIVCGAIGAAVYFWPRKTPVKTEGEI